MDHHRRSLHPARLLRRLYRLRPHRSRINQGPVTDVDHSVFRAWRQAIWPLYVFSGLILVRSVLRIVEYAMGQDGYILSHEFFLYIFDAALMFLTMVTLNARHPCHLPKEDRPASAPQDMEAAKGAALAPGEQSGESSES